MVIFGGALAGEKVLRYRMSLKAFEVDEGEWPS